MKKLFIKGARISIHNRKGTVYPVGTDHVTIIFDDQEPKTVPYEVMLKAFREQKLYLIDDLGPCISVNDFGAVDEKALMKAAYVNEVFQLSEHRKSRKRIHAIIKRVSADHPNFTPPSVTAVYNWVTIAEQVNSTTAQPSVFEPNKRKCDSRLSAEVNQLIFDAIDAYYMTSEAPCGQRAYDKFKEAFEKLFPYIKKNDPHKSTFYNRIKQLCPFEVALKRKGRAAAKLLRRTALQEMCAAEILEQVQFDAVHLNIPLYDDENNLLGTPVIHIAIDVYSRAITGFSVELNSESAAGVIECIKSSVSIKLHEDHPYTKNSWVMYGKPLSGITDGGSAYNAETVISIFAMLKIVHVVNEAYTPWHKAIVERFNLTLRIQFAMLFKSYIGRKEDGRDLHTLKKYKEKVTLNQFQKLLTCYIVDDYNQSPHNSLLKTTPANKWLESAEFATPIVPHSLQHAMLLKGNVKSATLHHVQGIRVNCVFYNSSELQAAFVDQYGNDFTKKIKVIFLYNPMDIKTITIRMNNKLIIVPSYKADYPVTDGMSLAENKTKRIKALQQAQDLIDSQTSRVDINEKIAEFLDKPEVTKPVDQSKKRGPSLPIDKVNEKMSYSKDIPLVSEEGETEEEETDATEMEAQEYFKGLILEDKKEGEF